MTDSAGHVLGPQGPIAAGFANYEHREEQLTLAAAVERSLQQERHLLAEAGTGIGKSFAYLVPAVQHAIRHRNDGPVVVSTRTIALQQQLEQKDLPFLAEVLGKEQRFTHVTAVGRNNYVCLRRMHLAQRERGLLFEDVERLAQLQQVVDWSLGSNSGTRMALPAPVADSVWEEVRAEHGNCLHRACPYFEPCPYQRARRSMETADILVVNHALYMADVALRMAGANYLPAHRVAIFDEAHHLERVATEGLGLRFTRGTLAWHLQRLHPKNRDRSLLRRYGSERARTLVRQLRMVGDEFFEGLEAQLDGAGRDTVALGQRELPGGEEMADLLGELSTELVACASAIESLDLRTELSARARGFETLQLVVRSLSNPSSTPATTHMVRWLEQGRQSPELRSAPLDVSAALANHVFGDARTCILVSATLGTGGGESMQHAIGEDAAGEDAEDEPSGAEPTGHFPWFQQRLGIPQATTLRLGSPFRYEEQVRVVLEEALPDPSREAAEYLRESRDRILEHIFENGGRALVLCTSWNFLRGLVDHLRPRLGEAGIPLLVQGEAPLPQLLHQKQTQPESVLVGTDSLWEGIDVRGDALTLLILTRFPFAQPDHPLTRARLQQVEARGGSGFWDHTLPQAILKFRQGFGRLVRSRTDVGKVVILDPRVRTRRYGIEFLRALPTGLGALDQEPI